MRDKHPVCTPILNLLTPTVRRGKAGRLAFETVGRWICVYTKVKYSYFWREKDKKMLGVILMFTLLEKGLSEERPTIEGCPVDIRRTCGLRFQKCERRIAQLENVPLCGCLQQYYLCMVRHLCIHGSCLLDLFN